jgi:hypothetical protein
MHWLKGLKVSFRFLLATLVFKLITLSWSTQLLGQGAAIFLPLSQTVFGNQDNIPFRISNRLTTSLMMKIHLHCEVDGNMLEGDACQNFFRLIVDGRQEHERITIPASGMANAMVSLKTSVKRYAFFKPRFEPQIDDAQAPKGVSFVFDYQPGYLFLVGAKNNHLGRPVFAVESDRHSRNARFTFDVNQLQHPQLVSVSAKIINAETKQMVRFLRLANEKIVDPRRGDFQLVAEYAPLDDASTVCYQLFIQHHGETEELERHDSC